MSIIGPTFGERPSTGDPKFDWKKSMNGAEKPDKRDHWGELVDEIGAEPAPSVEKPEDDATMPPAEGAETDTAVGAPPAARAAKQPPSRPPSDWNQLASQLGIEVPERDEPAAEYAGVEAAQVPVADTEDLPSEVASVANEVEPERDAAPDDSLVSFFEPDENEETDTALLGTASTDMAFASGLFEAGTDGDREAAAEDASPVTADTANDPVADAETRDDAPDSGDMAVDAEPTEQQGRRRRKRGRRRSSARRATAADADRPDADEATADRDDSGVATDDIVAATDDDAADEQATEERPSRRRRRKPTRRRKAAEATDAEEETKETVDDASGAESKEPAGRVKHRKIPTWDEAIGVVIDANMARRDKATTSKSNGRGGRRRGRGPSHRS